MTDCFALLGEPRRPVLDVEQLKARFHVRAAETHPDRFHNSPEAERLAATESHTEFNAAYNTLREPKDRLAHLLELELGRKPGGIESVPEDLMAGFMEVGQLCRQVDAFLAADAVVTSPILRVQRFQQSIAWTDKLNATLTQLAATLDGTLVGAADWNAVWDGAPPVGSAKRAEALPLEALARLFRRVSFLTRWSAQLRERVGRLVV